MNFLFWLGNHNTLGQRSLEDVIGIFGRQLRALGHRAVWDTKNDKWLLNDSGWNVIVEGFTPMSISAMVEGKAQGARYLILATEEPTEKGFNHGLQPEMVMRQQTFPEAAKLCEGIFYLVPGDYVHRWYNQFGVPAAYVELGYAPSLVRVDPNKVPEYDFGFYGSLSPRRVRILKQLARRANLSPKAIRVVGDFPTQQERDTAMRKAKVILQIRKFDEMGLVSSSRCNTALCLGRPVVAEPHLLAKPWDEVVRFSDTTEGFYDLALMARATWKGMWRSQFDKFMAKFPPEACAGKALYELGLTQRPPVAVAS